MPLDIKAERIHYREETAIFQVSFFADAAKTIPVVPLNATEYPAYTIYDINNQAITSGIGNPVNTPGTYKAIFKVPEDAILSYDEKRWRIEWLMVSEDNRQIEFVEEFDIRDTTITASEHREQKFITLCNEDFRATFRMTTEPHEIGINVYVGGTEQEVDRASLANGDILKAVDGDSLVYYHDVPKRAMAPNRAHSMIWKYRMTPLEPYKFVHQTLTSVSPTILDMVTSVRMLIDKFQKRLGTIQAYEDSDIVEYLARAHELVNATYPTTYYGLGTSPSSLHVFIVLYAAWWGLQAQQLLEVDLAFDFSGQTVTLSYDHQGALSGIADNWNTFIEKSLVPAKVAITRRNRPVGTVAGRQYRYVDYNTYTFKVGTNVGTQNIIGTLSHLGLLF